MHSERNAGFVAVVATGGATTIVAAAAAPRWRHSHAVAAVVSPIPGIFVGEILSKGQAAVAAHGTAASTRDARWSLQLDGDCLSGIAERDLSREPVRHWHASQ